MVGSHHPSESHFYLFVLGAAEQGRGIGSTAIRPVLDRCDADGLPAYLESSSERNRSFYERLGFQVLWEDRPTSDGPVFRGMWRDPGTGPDRPRQGAAREHLSQSTVASASVRAVPDTGTAPALDGYVRMIRSPRFEVTPSQ